jgi:5-methyltetrahydrofolate--homocysteine methyltransferase
MAEDLVRLLSELKENRAIETVAERLKTGEDPLNILLDAKRAMRIVGQRFSEGRYFIPDLVYSGKIVERITDMVKPGLSAEPRAERLGTFVIGTVAGDLHDIGKNLVAFMLDVNGFEVYDLGVDVPPQAFVDKVREVEPEIVGLSGFLTSVYHVMKETVDAIEAAGLRDKVKVMIGGGVMDDGVRGFCGADAYRPDAMAAVALAKEWTGEV